MSAWRLIDTAPHDGTPIWVFCPHGFQTSVVFHDGKFKQDIRSKEALLPTHWMPFPPPPDVPERPSSTTPMKPAGRRGSPSYGRVARHKESP